MAARRYARSRSRCSQSSSPSSPAGTRLHYPPGLGYDAIDHIAYAEGSARAKASPGRDRRVLHAARLLRARRRRRWRPATGSGSATRARLVQLLNAALALGTALLLLGWRASSGPGRCVLHVAALGFFVAGAVVLKAAAMFHPETLVAVLSTLALCARAHA